MPDPNEKPIIVGAVDKVVEAALKNPATKEAAPLTALKSLKQIDAVLEVANAKQPSPPSEYIVLIRHPQKKTLHPVMALKEGPGVVAVFENPEIALSQISTVKAAQNNEYYIIPVE